MSSKSEVQRSSIPSTVYGPVNSWRLGRSLGIDVLAIDSICSFECVYCQLGKINRVTTNREIFVSTERISSDLSNADWKSADVITLSGSGEPTLALNLGEIISRIKDLTGKPVAVLTNSTLLHDADVRRDLARADQIFCKLDAWSEETLVRFDRPAQDVTLEKIISGIRALRREFSGFLAIQTMILRVPDSFELEKFAELIALIGPDEVQLNIPTRPIPPHYFVESRGNELESSPEFKKLKTIKREDLVRIHDALRRLTNVPLTQIRVLI